MGLLIFLVKGEMSRSGIRVVSTLTVSWERGLVSLWVVVLVVSECGSVAGSHVLVLAGVRVSAPSVVTVLCEDAPSDSEWVLWTRSLFLSPRSVISLVEGQEDMKITPLHNRAPFRQWKKEASGALRKGRLLQERSMGRSSRRSM